MKIRRGYLIFGAVSVPLLFALLIWRENRNSYRAPGGITSLRIRQAMMIISELPNEDVPKEESQLITLLKSKWPSAPEEGSAENQILDGWGRPFAFSYQAATLSWKINSADRDGQFGTSDDKKGESMPREIKGEQGGADQPAKAPESKSAGKQEPQPESKPTPGSRWHASIVRSKNNS